MALVVRAKERVRAMLGWKADWLRARVRLEVVAVVVAASLLMWALKGAR
jgi:hypothetical protein